jgi:two-component system cell cycle response regulator DivK
MKLARDLLEFSGFRVIAAGDAETGVVLAREQRPDLVLMDVQLPGMDGVTALDRLRGDPETSGIPVVALTAFAMRSDRERFLAAGFDGYLEKPIDVAAFPRQIEALLDGSAKEAPR